MIKKLLLALLALIPGTLLAQTGVALGDSILGPTGTPQRNARVYLCTYGSTGNPCSSQASAFSDGGLTLPITQPFYTDSLGSFQVWVNPGTYYAQVTPPGQPTITRYYSIGTGAGSGANTGTANTFGPLQTFNNGITGGGNLGGIQLGIGALNNPFTWLGKQTFNGGIAASSVSSTVDVNTYAGADIGAKIGAAIAALSGAPCQLKITVPGTISTWPDIPMGCHIDAVRGTYTISTHIWLNHKDTSIDWGGSILVYTLDDGDYAFKIGKKGGFTTGTGTFTNGSATVTSTAGTDFTDIDSGDQIETATGGYNVQSKTNNTTITLTANFTGTTGSQTYGTYLDPTAYIGSNYHPVRLSNFSMYYTGAGTTAVGGISVRLTTKPILTNVRMFGFTGTGYGLNLFGAIDGEYTGVGVSFGKNGVWLNGGSYAGQNWGTNVSRFDSLFLVGNSGAPLVVDNFTSSALFNECHFEGNTATVSAVIQNTVNNIKFDTCYFERNGDGTTGSADVTVVGSGVDQVVFYNTFHTSNTANVPASGILASASTNVSIIGMHLGGSYSTAYNYISGATGQTLGNTVSGIAYGDPNAPATPTGVWNLKTLNATNVNGTAVSGTTVAAGGGQPVSNSGDWEVNVGTYTSGASPWAQAIPHKYGLTTASHCQAYAADSTSATYSNVSNTVSADTITLTYTGTSGHLVRFVCSAN